MDVLHVTSLYPNRCKPQSGIAIKCLIDALISANKLHQVSSTIFSPIPISFAPLSAVDDDWKCFRTMRRERSNLSEAKFIPTVILPRSKLRILCSKEWARRVMKSIEEIQYDLVHCHTSFFDGYVGRIISRKKPLKYVLTVRREIDFENNNLSQKEIKFTKQNVEEAAAIIAPSIHLARKCLKNTGREAVLIPNGVNETDIVDYNIFDQKKREMKDSLNIVTVATLDKNKRIDVVIECCSRLKASLKMPFVLHIVGDGPLSDHLQELVIRRKLISNVKFHGRTARSDVLKLLRESDIFILPSQTETFGLAYLEALAQGVPIIGRTDQGIHGMAFDGVHGFFRNDLDGFCEALETLSKSRELRINMGRNGLELARACTWQQSAKKLAKLYSSLFR